MMVEISTYFPSCVGFSRLELFLIVSLAIGLYKLHMMDSFDIPASEYIERAYVVLFIQRFSCTYVSISIIDMCKEYKWLRPTIC